MKFVVESLFHSYHSLGVVGVGCAQGLRAQPNVEVQEIRWPMSETTHPVSTCEGPYDYWLKISPGPVKIESLKNVAKQFIYLPCFESTEMTNWFPKDNFEESDIFACSSTWVQRHLPHDKPKLIWHHGINPEEIVHKTEANMDKPLKILFAGKLDTRKYGDEFINLFANTFGNNEKIQLIVKCQPDYDIKVKSYKNIKFINEVLEKRALNELYSECDVFMMPSRGEAFGMMGLEAAASGLPIITVDWGGQSDYIEDCVNIKVGYKLVDTPKDGPWLGQWAEPNEQSIIMAITAIDENRSLLKNALTQQDDIVRSWSWKATTKRFLNQL